MDGDNIRINNTPRNIFKASFVLTSNKFIPFWKCALTKHWTPSQLLFKDNIFVKCFLIAAFQSLTEAVSSSISLFLQLRSQITFVWKFFLVLIFYQVWKTRVKIMSGSTCIRKPGFLYLWYLKNYKNFFKSWARYFELNQVLLTLVGVHQKYDFFAQKSWFICDSKQFRQKYEVMLISI